MGHKHVTCVSILVMENTVLSLSVDYSHMYGIIHCRHPVLVSVQHVEGWSRVFACLRVEGGVGSFEKVDVGFHAPSTGIGSI